MTPYTEIYEMFFSQIDSHVLDAAGIKDRNILEGMCYGYLQQAVFEFLPHSRVALEPMGEFGFESTLGLLEKHILASGMRVAWLTQRVHDQEFMRVSVGDRDFRESEPWRIIRALTPLLEIERSKLNVQINEYTAHPLLGRRY